MNTDRILALADLIEKQPHTDVSDENGFTMVSYFHSCGTPACIAGWAMAMALGEMGPGLREKAETSFDETQIGAFEDKIAGEYLDISNTQEFDLFAPGNHDTITPTQAAATLRRLAETGEVKWEVE